MFIVHGLNDQNVTTNQFGDWWSLLAAHGVARKIWLSQLGHVDPFDYRRATWVRTLHAWFDYWLQGIDNGVMSQPQATIERADGHWATQPTWPAADAVTATVPLSRLGGSAARTFTDDPHLDENKAVAAPGTSVAGRAVFLSGALPGAVHIDGSPSVTLRVRVDRPTTELSVRLVDYGTQRRVDYLSATEGITTLKTQSCWGQSTAADDGCYFDTATQFVTSPVDILTRGWLDAAHHVTLRRPPRWCPGSGTRSPSRSTPPTPSSLPVTASVSSSPRATRSTPTVVDRGHGDHRSGWQQLRLRLSGANSAAIPAARGTSHQLFWPRRRA